MPDRQMLESMCEMDEASAQLDNAMWEHECWCKYLLAQHAYKAWEDELGNAGYHELQLCERLNEAKEKVEAVLKFPDGWLHPR